MFVCLFFLLLPSAWSLEQGNDLFLILLSISESPMLLFSFYKSFLMHRSKGVCHWPLGRTFILTSRAVQFSFPEGLQVWLTASFYKEHLYMFSFAGWDLWSHWQWQVIPIFGVLQNGGHIWWLVFTGVCCHSWPAPPYVFRRHYIDILYPGLEDIWFEWGLLYLILKVQSVLLWVAFGSSRKCCTQIMLVNFIHLFIYLALTKQYAIFEVGGKNMQVSGVSKFLTKEWLY